MSALSAPAAALLLELAVAPAPRSARRGLFTADDARTPAVRELLARDLAEASFREVRATPAGAALAASLSA